MKDTIEQNLKELYPTMFRDLYTPKTCMSCGCTCDDGWGPIIYEACRNISDILKEHPELDFKFAQIKEKFGALCLYYSGGNDAIRDVICDAERKSVRICEMCGTDTGVTREGSWIKTLCGRCRAVRQLQQEN